MHALRIDAIIPKSVTVFSFIILKFKSEFINKLDNTNPY